MGSLIQTFHLDLKLLIAQFVNFVIVALVLWHFALKPLMKIMNERTNKIEKSLKDAKAIEEKLARIEREKISAINQAKKEAMIIMEKANDSAEEKRQKMLALAKEEVEKIVGEGKKQMAQEKDKMVARAKTEIIDLVILVTKKILGKKIDAKISKELVSEGLAQLNKK